MDVLPNIDCKITLRNKLPKVDNEKWYHFEWDVILTNKTTSKTMSLNFKTGIGLVNKQKHL